MHRLVSDCSHHFAFGMHDLGWHTTHQMRLDLIDSKPVFCQRHGLSWVEWDIIASKVKELAKFGLVEPVTGNYAAATVLLVKNDVDGNYTDRKMCGDDWMLNLKTEQDRYPIPIAEDIFDRLEGCRYFTIMDMRQGFNQIEMRSEDKENNLLGV